MVPRTSDGIADDQAFGERSAIMRTSSSNRKQLVPAASKEHRSVTNMSADQAAIGNVLERNSLRKIGSLWLGLLTSHSVLLRLQRLGVVTATVGAATATLQKDFNFQVLFALLSL
jgi:hypothetical protein